MAGRRQSGGSEELKKFIEQNQLTPKLRRRVEKQKATAEASSSTNTGDEQTPEDDIPYMLRLDATTDYAAWSYEGPKLNKTQWDILGPLIRTYLLLAQIHCVYFSKQISENIYKAIMRSVVKVVLWE